MRNETGSAAPLDGSLQPFETVEIELALGLQDIGGRSFEDCVRDAVAVVDGEILFDVPADGALEDASRVAAIRLPGAPRRRIAFAVLNDGGTSIRVATRAEVGDRLYGFANAFVGVLERIRDDLSLSSLAPGGSA